MFKTDEGVGGESMKLLSLCFFFIETPRECPPLPPSKDETQEGAVSGIVYYSSSSSSSVTNTTLLLLTTLYGNIATAKLTLR